MRRNHIILLAFALGFSFPSFAVAQHRGAVRGGGGGGGMGGGGMHPGMGQHGGMMSPEEYMMHQFMMMGGGMSNRGYTGPRTNNSGSSRSAPAARPSPGAGNVPSGRSGHGNNAQPNATGKSKTQNSGQKSQQLKSDSQQHKKEPENREKRHADENSKRSARPSTKNSTHAKDSSAIRLLKNAHAKLKEADADYQGHRMRAMEHITSAVARLESGTGLNGGGMVGLGVGMGGYGGSNRNQSQSDEKLREARFHLQQTQSVLGTGTTAAEHHRNAHAAISEAIREVDTALRIK